MYDKITIIMPDWPPNSGDEYIRTTTGLNRPIYFDNLINHGATILRGWYYSPDELVEMRLK
jgi:hypothetical protein